MPELGWVDYGVLLDETGEPILNNDGSTMPIGKEFQFNVQARTATTNGVPGVVVASSDGLDDGVFVPEMFEEFQITVDQLEGEITLPYQIIRQVIENPDTGDPIAQQTIQVPRSQLGGFARFRLNYQYVNRDEEEVYIGEQETPQALIPRRPYIPPPPPPPVITIDEGQIKEALADKIYEKFFNSELIQGSLEDIKSFQTTQSPDGIGYSTGRQSDDDQLIFFKKDRNTPENRADFEGDGSDGIQAIADNIRVIFENADDNSTIDLSELLDDEITIQENVSPNRISSADLDPPLYIEGTELPLYYIENISYKLIYTHGEFYQQVEFASFNRFFENNEGAQRYQEDGQDKPDQWLNKLNLSQLTKPKFGTKVDINKARNLLDTNIFELLPNQAERQNEINQFFQKFQALIGNKPSFEDVDEDGAGEAIQDLQIEERISTAPPERKESSYITRLNQEADSANQNKTLQSMRDELNEYLGDVDNVIEEFPELPEYENKSEGFLKIRKHNQSIIIRNDTDILPLLKQKTVTRTLNPTIYNEYINEAGIVQVEAITSETYTGPSWQIEGFTVTMWVRFTNSTTGGSLMTLGNPMMKEKPGFRLDTFTRSDDNPSNGFTTNRRMVRLVVYEKVFSGGAIYDSHYGRDFDPNPDGRGVKYQTWQDGGNPAYEEFAAMENGSWHVFMQHTEIPTTDLNEWFFVCATYDPTIDEEGSFDDVSLFRDTDFWLNKRDYNGDIVANSGYGNKCKVEVISRRDLLTARGFRV